MLERRWQGVSLFNYTLSSLPHTRGRKRVRNDGTKRLCGVRAKLLGNVQSESSGDDDGDNGDVMRIGSQEHQGEEIPIVPPSPIPLPPHPSSMMPPDTLQQLPTETRPPEAPPPVSPTAERRGDARTLLDEEEEDYDEDYSMSEEIDDDDDEEEEEEDDDDDDHFEGDDDDIIVERYIPGGEKSFGL